MRILITGATGKVGSRLACHLAADGHSVLALVRRIDQAGQLREAAVETVAGDVTEPNTLVAPMMGAEAIVHCAAFFRGATPEQMRHTNVEGTTNLARAALRAGVTRLIFTSTGLVYGPGPGRPAKEADTPEPRSPYPQSKLAGEHALLTVPELDLQILRLAFVYGDGDAHLRDWLPQLRSWPTGRRLQLIHHRDIARAVDTLLCAPGARHRIYNLADDEALPAGTILESLREPAAFVPDPAGEVAFQGVMDSSLIRDDLGFRPAYPSLRSAILAAAL